LVLFLTQADAERILEKLKQNGQVKPQVWQVTQNTESAAAAAIEPKLDQSATAKTSAPADKVILLLTAPPL
jgi:hypothetical protein